MSNFLNQLYLFAQEAKEAAPEAAEAAEGAAAQPEFNPLQFAPFVIIFFFFWFFMIRPQKNEHKRQQELLSNLKKNDEVQTIGGIIGTITLLSDDYVTIKVDDNARLKMRRSSIQGLVTKEDKT